MILTVVLVIAYIAELVFCSSLAGKKGYSTATYFFLALLFGPIALLYLIGIPESDDRVQAKTQALADETAKRAVAAYFDELDRREGKPPRTDWPKTESKKEEAAQESEYAEDPNETYSDEDNLHYVRPMSYYNNKCPNCGTEYNVSRSFCRCGAQFGAIWRKDEAK